MKPILFVLALLAFSTSSYAEDNTTLGAFGGVGYTTTDASADDTDSAFGATLSTPMTHAIDVEIGAIKQENILQIPLVARIGLDKILTVSAGLFGETGTG